MTHQLLPTEVEKALTRLCEGIGSDTSKKVLDLVRRGRWDDLAKLKVNPLAYDDAETYFGDVAVTSFLRKCADLPTSVDRKAAAVQNFFECEQLCKRTNQRLSIHLWDTLATEQLAREGSRPRDACTLLIAEARKEMFKLLGKCPDGLKGRFGPGSTYADKGLLTTVPDKMSSRPTMTPDFWPHLFNWVGTQWSKTCCESGRVPVVVEGNRFTTVPKDCTKDRGIAVEPSLNSFYQLAYGKAIRKRLRLRGINLKDGQKIHQQVAREASISGAFATIDLSNASDTVCKVLVELLLPDDWFTTLSELRSPTTLIGGNVIKLEKFASMGNGYTFELETAIFLAISLAVRNLWLHRNPDIQKMSPGDGIWVYGDDIIVPTFIAEDVIGALKYLGFSPNEDKTFLSGDFRESCGGDYFKGVDVRSYYLKEFPSEPQQFIAMANGIYRMGRQNNGSSDHRRYLHRVWLCVLDNLPAHIRKLRGPESLGDLVIHDAPEYWVTNTMRSHLRYFKVYRPCRFYRVGWEHFKPDVVLATALYGTGDGLMGVTPRDAVRGYKVGWVPVPEATSKWLPT